MRHPKDRSQFYVCDRGFIQDFKEIAWVVKISLCYHSIEVWRFKSPHAFAAILGSGSTHTNARSQSAAETL